MHVWKHIEEMIPEYLDGISQLRKHAVDLREIGKTEACLELRRRMYRDANRFEGMACDMALAVSQMRQYADDR